MATAPERRLGETVGSSPAEGAAEKLAPRCPLCGEAADSLLSLAHTCIWRCANPACSLEFAHPQLDEAALRYAYGEHYYPTGDAKPLLAGTPDDVVQQWFCFAQQRFGPFTGKRLLDYGCGSGVLARAAREIGAQVAGTEPDGVARERLASGGFEVFRDLDDLTMTQPAARFDWIVLWDVIEHLRRPWDDLRALRALLAPGGRLLVSTPNARSLKSRLLGARWDQRQNLTHFHYFNSRSLAATFRAAGFSNATALVAPMRYSHHGMLRHWAQPLLRRCALQGELMFMASVAATRNAAAATS